MDSCVERENKEALCRTLLEAANRVGTLPYLTHGRLTRLTPDGYGEGEMEVHPDNLNPYGIVHGGALATLADTVTGSAVLAATGCAGVTVSYSMNYLLPADGKKIFCTARPERVGRHICVIHADLTNDRGELVACGEFTYCVTGPLDPKMLAGNRK